MSNVSHVPQFPISLILKTFTYFMPLLAFSLPFGQIFLATISSAERTRMLQRAFLELFIRLQWWSDCPLAEVWEFLSEWLKKEFFLLFVPFTSGVCSTFSTSLVCCACLAITKCNPLQYNFIIYYHSCCTSCFWWAGGAAMVILRMLSALLKAVA